MLIRSLGASGYVRVNRFFEELVGFDATELARKPFVEWLVDGDQQVLRDALEGDDDLCVVRHRTADGGSAPLEVRLRQRGDDGIVLARYVDRCDVLVACEEAEATVKSTLREIALIVQEQNPGYRCSILLVAHGRFVSGAGPSLPDEYNQAIDGFAIGPAVGSCGTAIYWNVPVIVEDIQRDPLWEPFAALSKKAGVAACWSHPFVSKGGRVLGALALYSPVPRAPTETQLNALRAAARMTGLAVERGRAEEALRKANAVKARFMANLSHEIRTPLNSLVGLSELMDGPAGVPATDAGMLRQASDQLLELFTGALELTELGDRADMERDIDLAAFCRERFDQIARSAREAGLEAQLRLAEDLPARVAVDSWSLGRVLEMLLDNAVKFTERGRIELEVSIDGGELVLRVLDSGCGIDLDRLEELRQPFVQGDLSTTKRYPGFGLGLALVDKCLEVLGGRIDFARCASEGTVVRVVVPVRIAVAPRGGAADGDGMRRRPVASTEPILVVEDNPVNQVVIGRMLDRAGYECAFRSNGEEALAALAESSYSCVLMDCQMPVMDGYEATRRIREREATSGERIPIIAVTANALAEDREICLREGMDEYVEKSVRSGRLLAVLESFVGAPRRAS